MMHWLSLDWQLWKLGRHTNVMEYHVDELLEVLNKIEDKNKLIVIESSNGIDCGDIEEIILNDERGGIIFKTNSEVREMD
jgi:SpoVK/Ycf46/Vps4 family AAA+-type ATPase